MVIHSARTWSQQADLIGIDVSKAIYAIGFKPHFRKTLAAFFSPSKLHFVRGPKDVPVGGVALIWGNSATPPLAASCKLLRVEDGFLRSVGLGQHFAKPISLVVDSRALYFDGSKETDFERMMNTARVSTEQKLRAKRLLKRFIDNAISKYNLGGDVWNPLANGRRIIVVPGQVESDASIAFGAGNIRTNAALVREVRRCNPDAWIAYKPHPDVVAKVRRQGADEHLASDYCDEIISNVDITNALKIADEVHTITSLCGFEALLRDKVVTCYGLPFYAGWGLTQDREASPRRKAKRDLSELVYIALIDYPLYVSAKSMSFITPEDAIDEIKHQRSQLSKAGLTTGAIVRRIINVLVGTK